MLDLSNEVEATVINLIPDPILIADRKGRCVLANRALGEAVGTPCEEVVGRLIEEFICPRAKVAEVHKRALEGEVREVDLALCASDGKTKILRWNWHPLRDRGGRRVGTVGIARDLSDIRRCKAETNMLAAIADAIASGATQEQILDTALERLAELLELNAAGILVLDGAGEELHLVAYRGELPKEFAVGSRVKLNESSAGEAIKSRKPVILQWGDALEADGVVSRIVSNRADAATAVALPLTFGDRPLGVLCVTFSPTLDFEPEDMGVLQAVASQIASALQQHKLADAVAKGRAELQAVIDSLNVGLYLVDLDGIVRAANSAIMSLTGRREGSLIGMRCREAFDFVDEAGRRLCDWACGLERADRSTPHTGIRAFVPLANTDKRAVYWSCSPLRDGNGNTLGWLEMVQDASHISEVEEMRSSFVSAVSHELLTPLAIIKGHAESLRDASTRENPAFLDSALTAIDEETERLRRMVANLLDVARIHAGGLQLSLAPLALPPLIDKIVRRFRGRSRRHRIETSFPEHFPLVLADRERIESVLYNLLDNAIKYSPRGGVIRVAGEVQEKEVLVRVSDEGVGIAWSEQERIFEPFYRVTGWLSSKTQGSGLGLFITKTIVDAHGGRIWVESRPGRGATFTFALPREAPAELPSVFKFTKSARSENDDIGEEKVSLQ